MRSLLATPHRKNLLDWEVDDENSPLLVGSCTPGSWDAAGRAGDPSVFRLGDRWYMAYYSWDGERTQDGMASTTPEEFPLGLDSVPGKSGSAFRQTGVF